MNLTECLVGNNQEILIRVVRLKDDCCIWICHEECQISKCLVTNEDAITEVPEILIKEGRVIDELNVEKLTSMPHKKLQHWTFLNCSICILRHKCWRKA